MKSTIKLQEYRSPEVFRIQLDNEISLTLDSPAIEPWGTKLVVPEKEDPFKTNLA